MEKITVHSTDQTEIIDITRKVQSIVDESGVIRHAEYVEDIGDHPDYEAALEAAKKILGA